MERQHLTTLDEEDSSERVSMDAESWDVQIERLAASFELTVCEVREDWSLVHCPADTNADVFERLRLRHAWDASMAPHYVKWLERAQRSR
jgi:hypothetical protein